MLRFKDAAIEAIHANFTRYTVVPGIPGALTQSEAEEDRKSTRLNSSHDELSRMPSSA